MAKLHEILAVKSGVVGKLTKLISDLTELFTKKHLHFVEEHVIFKPLGENQQDVVEKNVKRQTTVRKELSWIGNDFANVLGVCNRINSTNCLAKADVIVDGTVLLKDIPATGLLELEKHIQTFKSLLEKIPTLDPVKNFKPDHDQGEDVYKAEPRVTSRTTKEFYPFVLVPATAQHPAQATKEVRDVIIGYKHETEWSGMLTPAEKSDLLSRCEDLVAAIKSAQARANNIDVVGEKIGQDIVKYILGK